MKNMTENNPVETAVKSVVGQSLMCRKAIKAHLIGEFSENEIDQAIDTVLSQVRIKIV